MCRLHIRRHHRRQAGGAQNGTIGASCRIGARHNWQITQPRRPTSSMCRLKKSVAPRSMGRSRWPLASWASVWTIMISMSCRSPKAASYCFAPLTLPTPSRLVTHLPSHISAHCSGSRLLFSSKIIASARRPSDLACITVPFLSVQ